MPTSVTPSRLSALFGGLSGSGNFAAWGLAVGTACAYFVYGPNATAPTISKDEVAAFNAKRKKEVDDAAAAAANMKR